MAEKELPSDAEPSEEDVQAAVERAAKKKKLIVLGAIVVVLLLAAGGGTWFALRSFSKDTPPAAEGETAEHAEQAKDEHGKKEEGEGKDAHGKASFYDSLDPAFLANFTAGGRQHYLQLSLSAMVRDEDGLAALHMHMPLVRNRIVMQLSAEQFEQLQTDEGRQQLQQKLLTAMQEIMTKETGKSHVEQVFFTGFVLQ
jgi:flagellar FliL protein